MLKRKYNIIYYIDKNLITMGITNKNKTSIQNFKYNDLLELSNFIKTTKQKKRKAKLILSEHFYKLIKIKKLKEKPKKKELQLIGKEKLSERSDKTNDFNFHYLEQSKIIAKQKAYLLYTEKRKIQRIYKVFLQNNLIITKIHPSIQIIGLSLMQIYGDKAVGFLVIKEKKSTIHFFYDGVFISSHLLPGIKQIAKSDESALELENFKLSFEELITNLPTEIENPLLVLGNNINENELNLLNDNFKYNLSNIELSNNTMDEYGDDTSNLIYVIPTENK